MQSRLCQACLPLLDLQPICRCTRCGLRLGARPQAFGWTLCRHCKDLPMAHLRQAVVCADYTVPFDHWIAQLKYGGQWQLGKLLGQWLAQNWSASGLSKPDILLPVPCTRNKLKQRGYNQAALLCKSLSQQMDTPMATDWLMKTHDSAAQAGLDKSERNRNLEGVFRACRAIPPEWTVGLVDDVITTGATLDQCEQALRRAGANQVMVLAVCRTPEF